jgi:hypothetical protein
MEDNMRRRMLVSIGVAAMITGVSLVRVAGQDASKAAQATLKTSWGEPDLQGLWSDEY